MCYYRTEHRMLHARNTGFSYKVLEYRKDLYAVKGLYGKCMHVCPLGTYRGIYIYISVRIRSTRFNGKKKDWEAYMVLPNSLTTVSCSSLAYRI